MVNNHTENIHQVSDSLMTLLYLSFTIYASDTMGIFIMVGLTLIIFAINYVSQSKKFSFHFGVFHIYMLIFAFFSLLSALWAKNSAYAIEKGITLLELLICFSLLYASYYNAKIDRLLKILMWGGVLLAIYTIFFVGLNTLNASLQDEGRLENSFANINSIGMVCSTSLIIGVYYLRKKMSALIFLSMVPVVIIIAGSGSRKAFVMSIIGLLLLFYFQRKDTSKRKSNKTVRIIGSTLIAGASIFVLIKSGIFSGTLGRMDGLISSITGNGKADSSTMIRSYYRLLGLEQFIKTPLLGIGMGNARILALRATGHDAYLHCNYAEIAANGGIIGLIVCYWIYYYIFKIEKKFLKINTIAPIIFILLLIRLITDYGVVSYYSKTTYFFFMTALLHVNTLKRYYVKKK